jgi:MarR family transcriptional regulator for hemolysin
MNPVNESMSHEQLLFERKGANAGAAAKAPNSFDPQPTTNSSSQTDDLAWRLTLARAIHEFAHVQAVNVAKWIMPLGVSVAQSNVLIGLSLCPGVTSSNLAKSLRLKKASIGRVVQNLILMGMVETKPDPNDKRAALLRLSSSGLKMVRQFVEIGNEVNKYVMADIDEEKGRELLDLIGRMTGNLRKLPPSKIQKYVRQMPGDSKATLPRA